ncbi:MAG TPA: DUF1499 domain-containing protein [Geobacter sp.]|nr:DUF1499 domain-containing protein [Geobacter sp.]
MAAAGLLWVTACAGERPTDLGMRDGKLKPCPDSPNCVSSLSPQDGHIHMIAPLSFSGDPDTALARLKLVLGRRKDATVVEEKSDYLRVEFRTSLGFVDDAEFLLDRRPRLIQLRSASRLGYSDLGKNRSRVEEIRKQLAASLKP